MPCLFFLSSFCINSIKLLVHIIALCSVPRLLYRFHKVWHDTWEPKCAKVHVEQLLYSSTQLLASFNSFVVSPIVAVSVSRGMTIGGHTIGCNKVVTRLLQPCNNLVATCRSSFMLHAQLYAHTCTHFMKLHIIHVHVHVIQCTYSGTSLFQASELWPPLYNSYILFVPITYTCIN